ncbi:unnamed protein product [Adineta steineri]|uniref:Uncharacterized protein n=1 Tax=Adineta steineri TaxID=433720 RepID=A0A819GPP6_9BILA|nr:unnamed protein product [Adineta steineri]CAF3885325.1 unnamed protein product [Adineta steineri]
MNNIPITTKNVNQDSPPSLNYDLRARIKSNVIFWSSILVTLVIIPIAIYYPLTYLTKLKMGTILGFTSISNGLPSIFQLPYRIWKLWKKDGGDRRPLSGNVMDIFMWEYIISFFILTAAYIVSTTIPIPLLYLMIPSILVGNVSIQCLISLFRPRVPISLSSLPAGHKMRPAGYYITEDVVAVDGGGRSAYRKALNVRYESSVIFQRLIYEMTVYWAIGGLIFVGVNAAFTFATSFNFAFGATLIWIPIWALIWFIPARFWIQYRLRQEKEAFRLTATNIPS